MFLSGNNFTRWPMKLFNFFKRSAEPISDTWQMLADLGFSNQTASGKSVNAETAQSLPALYCAVSTIAEAVATMPLHVYRRVGSDRERASAHQAEKLLNLAPNDYQTPYDFKLALMRSVLLRGNGFARIDFDRSGKAKFLHLIHPDAVQVKRLTSGRIGYVITNDKGKQESLLQEEVIHVKYHSDDGIIGKSPVTVCRESIGLGLAQQEHGATQLKNGIRPSGVLEFDKFLPEKTMEKMSKDLNKLHSGTSANGKTLILEGGMKWKSVSLSNQDAEWLESRQFTVADIARMFKISPIYLMDYSNSTYSNHSEASRAFLSQSLRPWLSNLEQAIGSKIVPSRSQGNVFVEFQTADVLRATTVERYEVYDIGIRMGVLSPNECRKKENLSPRDGGDEFSQSWKQEAGTNVNND